MNLKELPKVELHLHLDCSLSFEVVKKLKPSTTLQSYQENFIAPAKCLNLADYLRRAVKGFELMQTEEQLRLVTFDLFKQLKADRIIYAEIRFAPMLHIMKGLSPEQVVEIVNDAVDQSIQKYGIEAGIILCDLRRNSEAYSLKTVRLVNQYKGTHVVGFDIAGNEAGFPIDDHVKAFQFANANNIKCTAHAGEARGAESVWETLEYFKPSRIGHGVRSHEDDQLMQLIKNKNFHLEVCPTSNIQVNVFDTMENHPLNKMFNDGISMSINTDTRTISNVTLTSEYESLQRVFNWDRHHFKRANLEAIKHAFASEATKEKIRLQIEQAYE
jgi:adenosine deaminase